MMASKKGIALTIIIISTITAASFFVWFIPQNSDQIYVISDYESNLNEVIDIHHTIMDGIDEKFQNVLDEEIPALEYIEIAEISSSQINAQIIKLVESQAPQEWHESYLNYVNALKEYNSFITETIVIANMIENDVSTENVKQEIQKIQNIKDTVKSLIQTSNETRP